MPAPIAFVGLNDYMLRNLLTSSFGPEARRLGLPLHGWVYPESHEVYRAALSEHLGMDTEAQELVRLADWRLPHLETLSYRAGALRAGRVGSFSYKAMRRLAWQEAHGKPAARLRLEAGFLVARAVGKLRLDAHLSRTFFAQLARTPYVRDVCMPRLRALAPAALVSASPETFYDVPWLVAAGELGIPRVIWIRSWDNITTKMSNLPPAEHFVVWSQLMRQELQQYYPHYRPSPTPSLGTLQFDGHCVPHNILPRREFCERMQLDPNKPIILYCTGGPHAILNEHLVIADLQRIVQRMPAAKRPQILVRLHPYFWNTDLRAYENLTNVSIWPRQADAANMVGGSTTGLLDDYRVMLSSFYHQAVNVNAASTVTLDSAVFDKPVINIAYDGPAPVPRPLSIRRAYRYDHYRHVVASGAVTLARSRRELERRVHAALRNPEAQRAGRRALIELECGPIDGKAGARLAQMLAQLTGVAKAYAAS